MNFLQYIIVGTLVFVSFGILSYFTIVSDSGPFAVPGKQLPLVFENIQGLEEGSRVSVLGAPMGKVIAVDVVGLDSENRLVAGDAQDLKGMRAMALIELKRPIVFYENYSIILKDETLMSGKVVTIDPGYAGRDREGKRIGILPVQYLDPEDAGASEVDGFVESLSEKGPGMITMKGVSPGDPIQKLSDMLDENRSDLRRSIRNIVETTDKVNGTRGNLGLLINDDGLYRRAHTLMIETQVALRASREQVEDSRQQNPAGVWFSLWLSYGMN